MAIFCFCSHYQSMIRRMITWQISAWKPFPASLFRLGWNSILILIHRLFQPVFLGWKYFSSLCQTGLECSTRAEFRGRLKLSRWNRQFDFKRISFGLSLPNDSSFPYMGWGGFFFFLELGPCDCVATKQPQNVGNNAAMIACTQRLESFNLELQS